MKYTLYGDGIHDDTNAIQQMIDSSCELSLPVPEKFYLISKPLELPSKFKLKLPRFAEIRLAPGSNCVMAKNKTKINNHPKNDTEKIWSYLDFYSPDAPCENIEIEGGVWNFNNKNQKANPISDGIWEPKGYSGYLMLFYNVKNLKLSHLTLKDPCTFSVTLDTVSYFSISDINFDFNDGNLYQSNMDGIHLNGNCHHGNIEKLFGTCYDDVVAMNANEGSAGTIHDISVRGIYTEGSYSAVRLLTSNADCAVRNVHISDIYGTFYHFAVSFQHYFKSEERGLIENVTLENVFAAKSDRNLVKFPRVHNYRNYGLIDFESHNDIKNLVVRNIHRSEYIDANPTILAAGDIMMENVVFDNITTENYIVNARIELVQSKAVIKNLRTQGLYLNGKEINF